MKILKLKSILFSLMAIAMVTVFLSSCEKDYVKVNPNENINNITANKYSGEDYFRGVFLLENEIASKISSLGYFQNILDEEFKAQPNLKEEYSKNNDALVDRINNRDSEYFTSLKLALESNNVSKVEAAIDYGNILLYDAIVGNHHKEAKEIDNIVAQINLEDYDLNTDEGKNAYLADAEALFTNLANNPVNESDFVEGRCWYLAAVYAVGVWNYAAAVNVAAAINYGAFVNVGAWVFAATYFWGKTANESDSAFEREQFVSELLQLNN